MIKWLLVSNNNEIKCNFDNNTYPFELLFTKKVSSYFPYIQIRN